MKKLLLVFLVSLFLTSCGPSIYYLIQDKDLTGVKKIIADGYDVNDKVNLDELFLASAVQGKVDVVEYLLNEYKPDINIRNRDNKTPLILATERKYFTTVKILLDYNANCNLQDNLGKTAMMYAVQNNDQEIVDILLTREINKELTDLNGMTARIWALASNNSYANERLKYYKTIDKYIGNPMLLGGVSTFTLVSKNVIGEEGIVYILEIDDEDYDWARNAVVKPGFHTLKLVAKSGGFISKEILFPVSVENNKIYVIQPSFDIANDQVIVEILSKD